MLPLKIKVSNKPFVFVAEWGTISLFIKLSLILLLPHFIFVVFNATSLALGVLIPAVFLIPLFLIKGIKAKISIVFLIRVSALFFFIGLYSIYSSLSTDDLKPLFSLLIFVSFLISLDIAYTFSIVDASQLKKVFEWLFSVLFLLGILSLFFDMHILNYELREKPIFPFSEQSHYSLTIGLVTLALISVSSLKFSVVFIFAIAFLAIIFPNLTLLVFAFIGAGLLTFRLGLILRIFYFILSALAITSFVYFFLVENDYFSSRLDFDEMNNLTTLVWVQGWQLAYLNFFQTQGFGLGFQALGLVTTVFPETSLLIYEISGKINNANDGGFLASKLISEFGIWGVVLTLFYLSWLMGYVFKYSSFSKKMEKKKRAIDSSEFQKKIILRTIIFGFVVEYFLRGYGYFSPTAILVIAAILYLTNDGKKYEDNYSK